MLWLAAIAQDLAAPPPGNGENDPAIEVVGSRIERDSPTATTVIDSEAIETFQPVSLLDVLDAAPGVRAISVGGIGGGSFVSVRGGEPNFTLVTLEGIKLNNPTNSRGGAFDFNLIDPDLVDTLTITRGPVSAIHGSDALSGMIGIRLMAPDREGATISARALASTREELGSTAAARFGWTNGGLTLAAGAYDSGDLDRGSGLERRQAMLKAEQSAAGYDIRLVGLYARSRRSVFPEDSGGPLLAVNRELEKGTSRLYAASLAIARERAAAVRPSLLLSFARQEEDSLSPAIVPGEFDGVPASTSEIRLDRLEAVGSVGFGAGPVSLILGAALLREEGRSGGTLDVGFPFPVEFRLDRTTASGFAEASFRPSKDLLLNVAARTDKVSDEDRSTTARVAGRWEIAPGRPVLSASLGQGYKQPSFFALGHPLIGNPDLKAEKSTNAEIGVHLPFRAGEVRLTVFRQRFRNLVDFDAVTFRLVNRSSVTSAGLEAEVRWTPTASLELTGTATLLDMDSPTPLRNRPRLTAAGRVRWTVWSRLNLSAQLRGNSRFDDASIPTGQVVASGHSEADLAARYDLTSRLQLDLALRNLFNVRAQDAVGFPRAGRLLRASVRARY